MVHIEDILFNGESPLGNSAVCFWAIKGGTGKHISSQSLIQHSS